MRDTPLPDLVLYGRPGCGLCDEARGLLIALLDERAHAGLLSPRLVERDIDTDPAWERAYFASIPVVELGDRASRARDERRQAAPPPDRRPGRLTEPMSGTDLTILVALAAGVISFLSPCVLPLVPAYLGSAHRDRGRGLGRWRAPVALAGDASCARIRGRVRCRLHGARHHGDVRRRTDRRLPAGAARHRRSHPDRARARPRGAAPYLVAPADLASARCRRGGLAGDRDRLDRPRQRERPARASATGSVAMSSARAVAGSRHSGSGRSSRSAGARASGSSSAGS